MIPQARWNSRAKHADKCRAHAEPASQPWSKIHVFAGDRPVLVSDSIKNDQALEFDGKTHAARVGAILYASRLPWQRGHYSIS